MTRAGPTRWDTLLIAGTVLYVLAAVIISLIHGP